MKRIHFSFFAVLALAALSFTACKKEDIKDNAPTVRNWTKFLLMGDVEHGKCVPGLGLCLTLEQLDPNNASDFPLDIDEMLAEPYLTSDGRIQFNASIPASRLSPEAENQLLGRRFLDFKNDIPLPEAIVKQAYEDAGVTYDGQQVTIKRGVYDASATENHDAAGNLVSIELCYNGSGWSICITIEF